MDASAGFAATLSVAINPSCEFSVVVEKYSRLTARCAKNCCLPFYSATSKITALRQRPKKHGSSADRSARMAETLSYAAATFFGVNRVSSGHSFIRTLKMVSRSGGSDKKRQLIVRWGQIMMDSFILSAMWRNRPLAEVLCSCYRLNP
jgi:hypothetical protein